MSEHEGPIVEAVEESHSVVDAAPEAPSHEDVVKDVTSDASTPSSNPAESLTNVEGNGDSSDNTNTIPDVVNSEALAGSVAESESTASSAEPAATESSAEAVAEEAEATAEPMKAEPAAKENDEADGKKVVRTISIGQEMKGTVKRIADFGAFVDIGVGRDGLLHVSELSVQRVSKVSDVLKQGQEVTVWIKELNREKNRISLTLISPDTKTIRDINKDDILEGTVTRMTNFGAFVDIGIGRDALLHVREMAEGFVKRPEDVVTIGETMEVRIVELNRRRGRVDLSIKGLRPEPESEEDAASAGFADGEEEFVDRFENIEPMSAIELALKRAMDADGSGTSKSSKRAKRKEKRNQANDIDDIISRTLSSTEA